MVAYLVPAGPLRDGVLVTGLAPCEIASVATTALAGGEAAVAAGVLIGSTLATVLLAAPVLTLKAGHASFSPAGVIANLAVVVALPLAAGIALRCLVPATARFLATDAAQRAASRTAIVAVAALVALVAAEVRLSASYGAVAVALAPVPGRLGRRRPRPRRAVPPAGRRGAAAHHLDARLRDRRRAGRRRVRPGGRRPPRPVRHRGPDLGHRLRRLPPLPGRPRRWGRPRRPGRPDHAALTRACLVQPRRGRPCWGGDEPQRRGTRRWSWGSSPAGVKRTELSYTSATSDTPLLGDTIGANLDRTVAAFPDRLALVDVPAGLRYSYAELEAEVDALAFGLLAAGIAKGDRVGIWSPNCAEWTLTQYATAKIGAILVNINPAYRTSELEFVLNQSGCKLLVAAQRLKTSDYAAMIAEVRPMCPDLEQVVLLDTDAWRALLDTGKYADVSRRNEALAAIELSADDPINIQYTSGTTGFPKGATLSHHNILNNGFFVGELCHYTDEDRICIPVPFYHCFGMVMGNLAATSHGAAMVIPAPAFDPVKTLEAVQARALHLALRRAHDVHRRARRPRLRPLRPVQPAHRHHGGLALPRRGDEAGHRPDGHGGGVDLLRHDRDLAGVHPDPLGRLRSSAGSPPSAGSARTSRSRSSTRRPA